MYVINKRKCVIILMILATLSCIHYYITNSDKIHYYIKSVSSLSNAQNQTITATTLSSTNNQTNQTNNDDKDSIQSKIMVVQMVTKGTYATKHKGMVSNIKQWCQYHNYHHFYHEVNQEMIDLYFKKTFLNSFFTVGGTDHVHFLKFWFMEDILRNHAENIEWIVMLDVDMIIPINSFHRTFEQLLLEIGKVYKHIIHNTSNIIFIAQDSGQTINGGFYMLHNHHCCDYGARGHNQLFVHNDIDMELQMFIDLNKSYFQKIDFSRILKDEKVISDAFFPNLDQISVQETILILYSKILNIAYNHECLYNPKPYHNSNVCYTETLNTKFNLTHGNRTIDEKYILLNPKHKMFKINNHDCEKYNKYYMFKHDHSTKPSEYSYTVQQAVQYQRNQINHTAV